MIPLILAILALSVPILILKPFSRTQKAVVFAVVTVHLLVILGWHHRLVRNTGRPIVMSTNVDSWKYYDQTRVFKDLMPYSIRKAEIINAAGGRQHLGYWYLNAFAHSITSYPILAIRFLKVLLFFCGLACVMRVWRTNYGNGLPICGFVFLAILYLVPAYYNFINYKDSLLFGLFLFLMALLDTLLRPSWQRLKPRTWFKTMAGWALAFVLLWLISTMRVYYAMAITFGVVMHLIISSGVSIKLRVVLLSIGTVVVVFVLQSRLGESIAYRIQTIGSFFGGYYIVKGLLTPIPWQYFVRGLIASHCFYLLLLPLAFVAFFLHLRKNLTWHFFTVALLIYSIGTLLTADSADRKRIMIVPIFVMWVLSALAYKMKTHINLAQYGPVDEQDQAEEFPEYGIQPEY